MIKKLLTSARKNMYNSDKFYQQMLTSFHSEKPLKNAIFTRVTNQLNNFKLG